MPSHFSRFSSFSSPSGNPVFGGGQKQKAEDIMSGVLVRLVKYHLKLYNPRQMLPRIEETIIIGSSKTKRDKETNSRIFPSLPFG